MFFVVLVALVFSLVLPTVSVQAAGKTATLVEFKHLEKKGYTLVFAISGTWKDADLNGNTITVDGKTYDLYCNLRDGYHVSCTMQNFGQLIGRTAFIFFGGQNFSTAVPVKQVCTGYRFYTVNDRGSVYYYIADSLEEGMAFIEDEWGNETYVPGPGVQCFTGSWNPYYEYGYPVYYDYIGNIYHDDYDGPPMG